jgi:hypothetical protein
LSLALLDEYVLGEDMKLVRCPEMPSVGDALNGNHWVFLAGGITNCPKWDLEVIEALKDEKDLVLFTPRRSDFDVTNPAMERDQIAWEFEQIRASDIMFFWFPEETLCPITLFELGKCAALRVPMAVGCHPNYKRRRDVIYQLGHIYRELVVRDNIADTVKDLKELI